MESRSVLIDSKNAHVNALYPMKVWLTALFLVAPMTLWLKDRILYGDIKVSPHDLLTLILLGLAGAVFSLPLYGILFFMFRYLTRRNVPPVQVKWALNLMGIAGIIVTFKLIDESPQLITVLCYSISIIIASLFFNIYSQSSRG